MHTPLTRRGLLGSVLAGVAAVPVTPASAAAPSASAPVTLPLYAGAIPGAIEAPDEETTRDPKEQWVFRQNVSRPTLSVYLPARQSAPSAAVVICPGGTYRGVSVEKEGSSVAQAFNEFGVAAVVLKYRTPSPRHMKEPRRGPLQDVQQAFHVVRQRASEWRIDPQRLGVVGFSAGGHVAATASTRFAQPVLTEHTQVRPDFSILIYPVVSMTDALANGGSRAQLLGQQPSAEMIARYSAELAVTDATPPAFLVHAADDSSVVVGNSLRYFEALNARKIRAQLFVYPRGGHGFGLNNATTSDRWIDRARHWMASEGLIDRAGAA